MLTDMMTEDFRMTYLLHIFEILDNNSNLYYNKQIVKERI